MTDPARKTADAIAARLTETILNRYQGDQPHMTKQADPNGRSPIGPPYPDLADVKPPLHVQAMLDTARAEGRADALADQLSDLSLDRMALVDRLVDREREAANVIVGLIEDRAKAITEAANTRALLDSATAKVDELQAEQDGDPRAQVLQTIWDTATNAITEIGGRNLTVGDLVTDRVSLLAERAIELHHAAENHDVDGDRAELFEIRLIASRALAWYHEDAFPQQHLVVPDDAVTQVQSLINWLRHERRLAEIVDQVRDIAGDTLSEHHDDMHGADAPPAAIPDDVVDLVGALRATLRQTRDRMQQLQSANDALQQAANGRHTVVDGDVRSHAEPAPTGFDVGAPYEQTIEAAPLPADVTQAIDVAKDAAATGGESPATPCVNCGHTRAAHDPGAEWNADQRAIHRSCKPPCPCSDYCDRRQE
ncbi:hypothetical protein J1763_gp70 [Gordonia phage YorkOnyx]|uniref:Uncharacterized protein n=1 Tax=Gordonia phage YorkOnyx TaxID=2762402 RepID=A0A7G8LMB9_9CAUD|nr:hypothetical protein J1763_gp70 [Gordonia phage YorkOnyx]QNJ58391.1 hypothetical protein SEA_YORKONYX_70 [Gordonia phage YorkOnyx]